MNTLSHKNTFSLRRAPLYALLLLGSFVLSHYLQLAPVPFFRLLLIAACFASLGVLSRQPLKRIETAVFAAFSCAVSAVLVLGYHIHMGDRYFGTMLDNYITPYSAFDAAALVLMIPALTVLFSALYRLLVPADAASKAPSASPACTKRRIIVFCALLVCYAPYLLAYWPGIVLNDTITSIAQALDMEPLVNHHPVLYTLFIKLCMNVGEALLGSRTAGYALYTIAQMIYVCACLSYLIDWVCRHLQKCSMAAACAMTALFGLVPYFASYSIAGWKDPVFSVSVAALSVMLLDDALHPVDKPSPRSLVRYLLMALMVLFSRTNGIGVIACVAAWQLLCLIVRAAKKLSPRPGMLAATVVSIAVFFVVHGPVFSSMGVTTDKREVNSLVLQQMARVAALDGDMSKSDRAFLNELLPIEKYKETYRPCCVDLLKWDPDFNTAAMENGMYGHWFSMLIKNPIAYIEAWELNTFGFWTLNVPEINYADWNLSAGVIRNKLDPQYVANTFTEYGIEMKNLFGGNTLRDFLPTDEWFIPAGLMFWGCVFLLLCMLLRGQFRLLIALVPTFGLLLPLILVTPTCYWIRYAAAAHYLIPVYLWLFAGLRSKK